MMPILDGTKFCERRLQNPKLAKIPVLIMTADRQIESRDRQLKVCGIVMKPLEIHSLLNEIAKFIS